MFLCHLFCVSFPSFRFFSFCAQVGMIFCSVSCSQQCSFLLEKPPSSPARVAWLIWRLVFGSTPGPQRVSSSPYQCDLSECYPYKINAPNNRACVRIANQIWVTPPLASNMSVHVDEPTPNCFLSPLLTLLFFLMVLIWASRKPQTRTRLWTC